MADFEALKELRKTHRGQFTRLKHRCEEYLKDNDAALGMSTVLTLKHKFSRLEEIEKNLVTACSLKGKELSQFIVDGDDNLNDKLTEIGVLEFAFNELLSKSPVQQNISDSTSHSNKRISLPKLQLPKFSGEVLEWPSFWDLFAATVDQQRYLSDIEKFSHLLCYLTGEAKAAIEGLSLTCTNYETAKSMLIARFGQPHKIAEAHLNVLINLENPSNNQKSLRSFYDKIETNIRALSSLGRSQESYGTLLVTVIFSKLPPIVKANISRAHGMFEWSLNDLLKAILNEILIFESCSVSSFSVNTGSGQSSGTVTSLHSSASAGARNSNRRFNCLFCEESNHMTFSCQKVIDPNERLKKIRELNLCFNCFGKHRSNVCRSKFRCKKCSKKHHSTLCGAEFVSSSRKSTIGVNTDPPTPNRNLPTSDINQSLVDVNLSVLLKTAVVSVQNINHDRINGNVIFDDGSQRTFVTQQLADRLGNPVIKKEFVSIGTFGSSEPRNREVNVISIGIICDDNSVVKIEALVIPTISRPLSHSRLNLAKIPEFKSLKLAHSLISDELESFAIDILIGSDHYYKFIEDQIVRSSVGPVAVSTRIGYIITGPCLSKFTSNTTSQLMNVVYDSVERFWDLDVMGIKPPNEGENFFDNYCDNYISKSGNTYVAKLPWKQNHDVLPSNFGIATARTRSLARRLSKTPDLLDKYQGIIRYQLERQFIEKIENPEIFHPDDKLHYLAHHPVFKQSSTTPMRVVFDCSCRQSKNSCSLNDCLEPGPALLNDITSIFIRFRLHKYALITDIEKAFLHVGLHNTDRDVTRFLWLSDPKDPESSFDTFRFKRVLFGATCSPFILNSTLIHHLRNNGGLFSDHIQRDIYVDNVSTSIPEVNKVLEFYQECRLMKENANFNFCGWASNCPELNSQASFDSVLDSSSIVKNLGLYWDIKKDKLLFPTNDLPFRYPVTKRNILHSVATIFDPLGYLNPVTVRAKILLQDIWKEGFDWDIELPSKFVESWESIFHDLCNVLKVDIPRRYFNSDIMFVDNELHVFGDASSRAYGAVAYLKTGSESKFIMSKCRIAPLKELSVPKLELMAATVAARLCDHVKCSIKPALNQSLKTYLWSDSQVVLGWIRSNKTQSPFVSNRVSEIKKLTSMETWQYVPSESNPADLLTRGVSSGAFIENDLWNLGPSWLGTKSTPNFESANNDMFSLSIEVKPVNPEMIEPIEMYGIDKIVNVDRYSTFSKLVRVSAWVRRFIDNVRKPVENLNLCQLRVSEIDSAEKEWFKITQGHFLSDVIKRLQGVSTQKLPVINQLQLFIDQDGIVRCRGRIQNSTLSSDCKHPILVPKNCSLSRLIINESHTDVLHFGTNATVAKIRERFWIPQIRSRVKQSLRYCSICRRIAGKPYELPSPPPLPTFRVCESRPFQFTGLDYCGPLLTKDNEKCYVVLFTCCVTRAIHLEIVQSNSTDDFSRAFRKFCARRSLPRLLISDNASTFIGANSVLKEIFKSPKVHEYLSKRGLEWKFITKRAPWQGGFYERLIGLTKTALKKCLGNSCITFDELYTVLIEIESVLNDRPLMYTSSSIDDESALTPSELFCGRKIRNLPYPADISDPDFNSVQNELHKRYIFIGKLLDRFWSKWKHEYLVNLREAHRSFGTDKEVVKEGSVVIIHDDFKPRLKWKFGIITELHRGADNCIRSVSLKTANGFTNRPISKLYPLEVFANMKVVDKDKNREAQIPNIVKRPLRQAAVIAKKKISEIAKSAQ